MILRFTADVIENNIFSGRRILNKELKMAFDKEGISIPYPQMEVRTIRILPAEIICWHFYIY